MRIASGPPPADETLAEETTEALLLGVADRDRACFRALYDRTSAKLFAIVLRICRDRPMAEDALQEVYVDIWRQAGRFDPARGTAGAWTAAIARNRAIDRIRKAGRPGAPGTEDPNDFIEQLPDTADLDEDKAALMTLLDCLGRLEERTRNLILLAYYEGWTREELAARESASVNTVKTWLRRGLMSLRDCIGS